MIKIIDFDNGCGGLTAGMERFGKFRVIDNLLLNNENKSCYNSSHCCHFDEDIHISNSELLEMNNFIASLTPSISVTRKHGVDLSGLTECVKWVDTYKPDVVILSVPSDAIPHFFTDKMKTSPVTSDGWPLFDMVLDSFHGIGYKNVQQFTVNYSDYNIPIKNSASFYVAWNTDNSFKLHFPKIERKYTVMDFLSKIDDNIDDISHKPNFKKSDICSHIKQGSSAKKTDEVKQTTGYIRLVGDRVAPRLYNNFTSTASSGPSIHPIEDRPLTIREGALLFGLDYAFEFGKFPNKVLCDMIVNSVSPIIGYYIGQSIFDLF